MTNKEILKSVGFTDAFLTSLSNYEKLVPLIEVSEGFAFDELETFTSDRTDEVLIIHNDQIDYTQNILIK